MFFPFLFKFIRTFCKQTVETLIRKCAKDQRSKCAKESCLVYQKYQENNYICITIHTLDRFTLQDKELSGLSYYRMNGSTFCEIKYMKGFFYMIRIGVGLKILARTPLPKLPTKKIKFSKQKQR